MSDQNTTRPLWAHNEAHNRYLFQGELRLNHAAHIGSGRGDDSTDALVVVDGRGRPVIPGSSLRGVLRAYTERVLAALNATGSSLWACGLYESELPADKICVGNLEHAPSKAAYEKLGQREETNGAKAVWKDLPELLCDACRLFGAGTFLATKIRFTDLPLIAGGETDIRHGVGIHRDTGTAAPAIKYDKQVVAAESAFQFEAVGENLDKTDLAILSLALQSLRNGDLAVGGSSGRGLGTCQLQTGQVYWVDMKEEEQLLQYLTKTGSPASRYPSQQELGRFVETQLAVFQG